MDKFITAIVLAVVVAPLAWPAFVMIYRYFRDLEDQRFAHKTEERDATDVTAYSRRRA